MATKRKKKKTKQNKIDSESLMLIIFGIISGFIVYTSNQGGLGHIVKNILLGGLMGKLAYAIPFILVIYGIYVVFREQSKFKLRSTNLWVLLILIASTITCFDKYPFNNLVKPENMFAGIGELCKAGTNFVGGGLLGAIVAVPLEQLTNMITAKVIIIIALIVFSMVVCGIAFSSILYGIQAFLDGIVQKGRDIRDARIQDEYDEILEEDEEDEQDEEEYEEEEVEEIPQEVKKKNKKFRQILEQTEVVGSGRQMRISDLTENLDVDETPEEIEDEEIEDVSENIPNLTLKNANQTQKHQQIQQQPREANKQKDLFVKKKVEKEENTKEVLNIEHSEAIVENYDDYEFPPVELLQESEPVNQEYSVRDLREVASKLQTTLSSFNVDAKVVNATKGPTVTQYEVQPNVGVKVNKILGLEKEIALNLAAKSIRIEAPIPGKSAVGIEVPNITRETVSLREVIDSNAFREAKSRVSFALGKSIDGEPFVSDIAKMPHMLIAGSTGSGKSVCVNSILVSLLYKAKPNEVKLILIDPKVVELKNYNGIPHLLIPVVTDAKKAAGALNWAVQEMVNRYNLFAAKGVRDIKGYNNMLIEEGEEGVLPQIVIVVDELADLMMVAAKEVEDAICRLAQMARAAGMHLIIATQRPSVDVVTGIIKANIPSRIAFTVSSQIDSRTILDMAGAEKLLGKGDMLYYPMGEEKPIRVQGTFVSDKEIETVIDFIKSNGTANYDVNILETFENANKSPQTKAEEEENDYDEFLFDAIELAVQMGNASASMLQRKFKVGYARAGRIIDQMEERGIISGYEGSKPRKTLITKEEWENMKEEGIDSVKIEDVTEEDIQNYSSNNTNYIENTSDYDNQNNEEYDEEEYEEVGEEYEEQDDEEYEEVDGEYEYQDDEEYEEVDGEYEDQDGEEYEDVEDEYEEQEGEEVEDEYEDQEEYDYEEDEEIEDNTSNITYIHRK